MACVLLFWVSFKVSIMYLLTVVIGIYSEQCTKCIFFLNNFGFCVSLCLVVQKFNLIRIQVMYSFIGIQIYCKTFFFTYYYGKILIHCSLEVCVRVTACACVFFCLVQHRMCCLVVFANATACCVFRPRQRYLVVSRWCSVHRKQRHH